jgi:hypothetical protein
MRFQINSLLLIVAFAEWGANAFLPTFHAPKPRRTAMTKLSANPASGDDDGIGLMRRLLESSWQIDTMGPVPSNAESAADTAANSLKTALADSTSKCRAYFIDILLPQYDIHQGEKVYDEVLAVEFCTHLARKLQCQAEILVRDAKTVDIVNRVLSSRSDGLAPRSSSAVSTESSSAPPKAANEVVDSFDDFTDDGLLSSTSDADQRGGSDAPTDVDSFRQQLIAGWSADSDDKVKSDQTEQRVSVAPGEKPEASTYRLASLFGDSIISSGTDLHSQVLAAVAQNAKPTDDESLIVLLSTFSPEEMLAVRTLVAKYGDTKTFVLVNCSLNPTPRELATAQTVYSILPLIAKTVVKQADDKPAQPKVVVMRRFPGDWEVFVDADANGFELAHTFGANRVDRKGPTMQRITECVQSHLLKRRRKQ